MFRAYNPAQDRVHREIFAVWIDKSRQTLSQLAIETTLYGQSYSVSPAMAQWWEGDTPVSQPNPSQPLHIDNAWIGPFGDTVVGSIMLDPAYTVSDLWKRDTVRQRFGFRKASTSWTRRREPWAWALGRRRRSLPSIIMWYNASMRTSTLPGISATAIPSLGTVGRRQPAPKPCPACRARVSPRL